MRKEELRQKMMMCVCTLYRLNGNVPGPAELYGALGKEYEEVLEEYFEGKNVFPAAA